MFGWDRGEAVARRQDELVDVAFECPVIPDVLVMPDGSGGEWCWHRVTRAPCLHWFVIAGEAYEEYVGAGIGRVAVCPARPQIALRMRLDVFKDNHRGTDSSAGGLDPLDADRFPMPPRPYRVASSCGQHVTTGSCRPFLPRA